MSAEVRPEALHPSAWVKHPWLRAKALHTAARFGEELKNSQIQSGDEATWMVWQPVTPGGKERHLLPADGYVYQGASGIALFLAELAAVIGDASLKEASLRGLRYAVRDVEHAQFVRHGYFSGQAGVISVAARIARVLGSDEARDLCMVLTRQTLEKSRRARTIDVINGMAGTLLGVLGLGEIGETDRVLSYARNCGEMLDAAALRRTFGWSWRTTEHHVQHLCGYAHGAAGIAHAFFALGRCTNDARWGYAGARALAYEESCALGGGRDWPDYRVHWLRESLESTDSMSALREAVEVRAQDPESSVPPMRAWCHGAPGIAGARLAIIRLGYNELVPQLSLNAALEATRETAAGWIADHSLCHGFFGNIDVLTASGAMNMDHPNEGIANRIGAVLHDIDDGKPWFAGVRGATNEPSLMLGSAGIGLSLLRMCDSTIPSPLTCGFEYSEALGHTPLLGSSPYRACIATELRTLYPHSIARLTDPAVLLQVAVGSEDAQVPHESVSSPQLLNDYRRAFEIQLENAAPTEVHSALRLDLAVMDVQNSFSDVAMQTAQHLLSGMCQTAIDESTFRLSDGARIIFNTSANGDARDTSANILYRREDSVGVMCLPRPLALLLSTVKWPINYADLLSRVSENSSSDSEAVKQRINQVLTRLTDEGVLWRSEKP